MKPAYITGKERIGERFNKLRDAYAFHARMVAAGEESWMHGDPYAIADWISVFTPIERAVWCDIRSAGLMMWPQLPVGKYFVDFGNPVIKIAIECDGAQYHDAGKDAKRDAELLGMGWRVIRIPGWKCLKTGDDANEEDTTIPIIRALRCYFEGRD